MILSMKLNRIVFYMFVWLLFFDFITKDIFINYFLSADGVKVQLYKVYVLLIYFICWCDFLINKKYTCVPKKNVTYLMLAWLCIGSVNLILLPFISEDRVVSYAYVLGDFVGWTIIPVLYFVFSSISVKERDELLLRFAYFMRILLLVGVIKFLLLKFLGIRVIPMGFPVYYLYTVWIYSFIIGFNRAWLSLYLSNWEKKYSIFIFLCIIFLMVAYAQRTQLIVIAFIVLFMTIVYGHWNLKKVTIIVVFPLLIFIFIPYMPETVIFKFQKLMTGDGTILPNGLQIPYLLLDNSLTQRFYEAIDAISDLIRGGIGNIIFGYGNGASFKSNLMASFKDEPFIHHIHVSYIAALFRVGFAGLSIVLLVFLYSALKVLSRSASSLIGVAILCVAVDILFFQKLYYSFELPLYLAIIVLVGVKYDNKQD